MKNVSDKAKKAPVFKTEQVAYWFFRLNGCLNIVNFLVHHERRGREGTDVDILAARFPHRKELALSDMPMKDHAVFDSDGRIDLIIAEVKIGRCRLNGPWIKPNKQNMNRVLYAIGAFSEIQVPAVAQALYQDKYFEDDQYRVRLFAVGRERNDVLGAGVVQLIWDDVLSFIYERFDKYRHIKSQNRQWDTHGRTLFNVAIRHRSPQDFTQFVIDRMES